MKAIAFDAPGDPEVLYLSDQPDPTPGPDDLLVRVRASALNRADTLQRLGGYPPPPEESEILGLELAGDVEAIGHNVTDFVPGDRVFGLVGGGGYAEKALLHAGMAMRIPDGWSYEYAAAVPEVFFTANETLFTLGRLTQGETVLIHAGASGVGTAGLQMARQAGARVFVTAGSADKIERTVALGAEAGINYKAEDFAERVMALTDGAGVELVQCFVGAPYWQRNLDCLKTAGRLVLVGLMGGAEVNVNLSILMGKRLTVIGSVMRSQPLDNKIAITQRFRERWLPLIENGTIHAVIDRSFPLAEAAAAHRYMEENRNVGKILLVM